MHLTQDGSKASFNVIECKKNYCRGLTKEFYHCAAVFKVVFLKVSKETKKKTGFKKGKNM
jgi:hypothetical protein